MSPLEMLHGDDEVSSLVRYQNSSSMEHHVDHEQHDTITTLSMLSSRRAPSTSRIVQPPSKEQTSDIAKRLSQVDKQLCSLGVIQLSLMHISSPFSNDGFCEDEWNIYGACYEDYPLMMLPHNNSDNVEHIIQELVHRNDVLQGTNRKRKASSISQDDVLDSFTQDRFRAHLFSRFEDSDTCSSEADSPPDYTSTLTVPEYFPVVNSPSLTSSTYNIGEVFISQEPLQEFTSCLPIFPPYLFDEIQAPLRGFGPLTKTLSPPRQCLLDEPSNQKLFSDFLRVSAVRMGHASPVYIDLFRKYIPAMAQQSPALMESLLAIAALQVGMMKQDQNMIIVEAANHYQRALTLHGQSLADASLRTHDATLATALMMTDYEFWSGENVKMGVHMLGARDIILGRGKEAHMSPVGRALFTAFRRIDIGSSAITGNPCFLTNDWWLVDPLSRVPIEEDSPPLLAADAALAKIIVICSKLTYIKAWATKKRRELWVQSEGCIIGKFMEVKKKMQKAILRKVARLEDALNTWTKELPKWFRPSDDNVSTGKDGQEEDINKTDIHVIIPRKYKHWSIACVEAWEISVRLQMYRIKYPDAPQADPVIGGLVHAVLRIFAYLPSDCDGLMMPVLFLAGMELRQKPHQEWLANTLQQHMQENTFPGFLFVLHGCRFAWMKLEGQRSGRFARIKEGAAARIEGVSENLWSAEGVLGSLEALSLYDSPDTSGQRKNFQGDLESEMIDEDDVDVDGGDDTEQEENANPQTPSPAKIDNPPTPSDTPSPQSIKSNRQGLGKVSKKRSKLDHSTSKDDSQPPTESTNL